MQLLYFITTVTSQVHSARHHQRAGTVLYRASSCIMGLGWGWSIMKHFSQQTKLAVVTIEHHVEVCWHCPTHKHQRTHSTLSCTWSDQTSTAKDIMHTASNNIQQKCISIPLCTSFKFLSGYIVRFLIRDSSSVENSSSNIFQEYR